MNGEALAVLEACQPWSWGARVAKLSGISSAPKVEFLSRFSPPTRLRNLSNIDKHRHLTFSIISPDSVSGRPSKEGSISDLLSDMQDIKWLGLPQPEPISEEVAAWLRSKCSELEQDECNYDFFFSNQIIVEGCEIGRYLKHDHDEPMSQFEIEGSLRVVLFEPGLTDLCRGAPSVQRVLAEMIQEVEDVLAALAA